MRLRWGSITSQEYRRLLSKAALCPSCWKASSILKHLRSSQPHNKRWDEGNQLLYSAIWTCAVSNRSRCRCIFSLGCWDLLQMGNSGNLTLMNSGCYKVRAEAFNVNRLDSLRHTRHHITFCRLFRQEPQKNLWIFCLQLLTSKTFSSVRWG